MVDLIAPRRGEAIVASNGVPTNRFFEYLEAATTQTNETIPDTEIDSSSINLSVGGISENARRIKNNELLLMPGNDPTLIHLLSKNFKIDEYATDHTVTKNEIVICTAAVTITLIANFIGQRCYIKRTNGPVTIVGTIDNKTNVVLNTENSSLTLVYTSSGWWII